MYKETMKEHSNQVKVWEAKESIKLRIRKSTTKKSVAYIVRNSCAKKCGIRYVNQKVHLSSYIQ